MGFKKRRVAWRVAPLPEPNPLAAPRVLLKKLEMMWSLLQIDDHGTSLWLEQALERGFKPRKSFDSVQDWRSHADALSKQALADDDEALFELVKRDPRYLSTELVQTKVMLWRLQVIFGTRRRPDRSGDRRSRSTKPDAAAQQARKKLHQLRDAVVFVSGQGKGPFLSLWSLLNEHGIVLDQVKEASELLSAKRTAFTANDVAAKVGLVDCESEMGDLIAKPKNVAQVTRAILARRFGVKKRTMERYLARANELNRNSSP